MKGIKSSSKILAINSLKPFSKTEQFQSIMKAEQNWIEMDVLFRQSCETILITIVQKVIRGWGWQLVYVLRNAYVHANTP